MPKHIEKLMNLLPNLKEINEILLNENEAKYIFNKTLDVLHTETTGNAMENNDLEEVSFLIQALVDRCWERIHTGHFSEVSIELRKIYALACYFKIILLLIESWKRQQIDKCNEFLNHVLV